MYNLYDSLLYVHTYHKNLKQRKKDDIELIGEIWLSCIYSRIYIPSARTFEQLFTFEGLKYILKN